MKTRKLEIRCPLCESADVTYSCSPHCCFNHVCGECFATFEPVTEAVGGKAKSVERPDSPPDSAEPTAACAVCESTAVFLAEDGAVVCADCRSLLRLELTAVTPG